ncbi:hypothetical protein VTK73DRAFT_3490 [Phialemonium thermophilum]|uniref:Myb-like domain-containing protein n=1 Tax=Phialemonium thermophilum TaxID=223376 RepID=A0ABR3WYX2_9PEZI
MPAPRRSSRNANANDEVHDVIHANTSSPHEDGQSPGAATRQKVAAAQRAPRAGAATALKRNRTEVSAADDSRKGEVAVFADLPSSPTPKRRRVTRGKPRDGPVNQAALDAINAFNRRTRARDQDQAPSLQVRLPSAKTRARADSNTGPEQQLRSEAELQQERAEQTVDAAGKRDAYSVASSDGHSVDVDLALQEVVEAFATSDVSASSIEVAGPRSQESAHSPGGNSQDGDEESPGEAAMAEEEQRAASPELNSLSPLIQSMEPGVQPGTSVLLVKKNLAFKAVDNQANSSAPELQPRTRTRSRPRVVKPAYETRSPPEDAPTPVPTARAGLRPRHSEPAPRPISRWHRDPDAVMSSPLAQQAHRVAQRWEKRGEAGTPRRLATPSVRFEVEESEEEEDDHDSSAPRSPSAEIARGRSVGEPRLTALLTSKTLWSMRRLLGLRGWTGMGPDWTSELLDSKLRSRSPRTKLGRRCWQSLVYLQLLYGDAPRAPKLDKQDAWFRKLSSPSSKLSKTLETVDILTRKIAEEYLTVRGDSDKPANEDEAHRLALARDLIAYIIPMLFVVLQTTFLLGGAIMGDDGRPALPAEGQFSSSSLALLERVADWAISLVRALNDELERRPLEPPSDEESSDGEGGRYKKAKDGRWKAKEAAKKQRCKLGDLAVDFRREVRAARARLEAAARKEELREQSELRQKELLAAKRREEEAEMERKQQRFLAMCQSTQRMRQEPDLISEKWLKARAYQERATSLLPKSPGFPTATAAAAKGGVPAGSRGRQTQTRTREQPGSSRSKDWRPWLAEERRWLLQQLRAEGGRPDLKMWAEVLGRDVEDVSYEVRMLKISWRLVAKEKGVEVEAWAR